GGRHARVRSPLLPHDAHIGPKACALLHDGRVFRVPGNHRWRPQPARVPDRGERGHAHRDAARPAGGGMSAGANTYDVAVVGAGPAGLAAAAITAGADLTTLLLDENPAPGGQIYRAVTTTPLKEHSILGEDYWAGAALVAEAKASGAE